MPGIQFTESASTTFAQACPNDPGSPLAMPRVDFDGNGTSDLLITTAGGTYEYFGTQSYVYGGGFTHNDSVWDEPSWTMSFGTPYEFVPGDFNGDGFTDFIMYNSTGSYEYLSQGPGNGFAPTPWQRTDLPYGNVSYTPGDFNGDGVTDLIITTAGGSYEYLGVLGATTPAIGGFQANVWQSPNFTLGSVIFTAGDFNGDGSSDLIITNASGSSEYLGTHGSGGITLSSAFVRPDLVLGDVGYTAGDFNHELPDRSDHHDRHRVVRVPRPHDGRLHGERLAGPGPPAGRRRVHAGRLQRRRRGGPDHHRRRRFL